MYEKKKNRKAAFRRTIEKVEKTSAHEPIRPELIPVSVAESDQERISIAPWMGC